MAEEHNLYFSVTQPVDDRVLKDVVAFVEVRTANDNRSESVRKELEQLGATVVKKFTDDVTHVVFKEGSNRTKVKAQKKEIHFVSVLWVDHCKRNQQHVSERMFPAHDPKPKGTPLLFGKMKKAKSMQPRDFHEELADSAERIRRKRKRLETIQGMGYSDSTPPYSPQAAVLVQDTQPRLTEEELVFTPVRLTIPDTPPGMRDKMKELNLFKENEGNHTANDVGTEMKQANLKNLQKKLFTTNLDTSDIESIGRDELEDDGMWNQLSNENANKRLLHVAQEIKEYLGHEDKLQGDNSSVDSNNSSCNLSQNLLYPHEIKLVTSKQFDSFTDITSKCHEEQKHNLSKKLTKVMAQKTNSRKLTRHSVPHSSSDILTCIEPFDRCDNKSAKADFIAHNDSLLGVDGFKTFMDKTDIKTFDELHLQLNISPVIKTKALKDIDPTVRSWNQTSHTSSSKQDNTSCNKERKSSKNRSRKSSGCPNQKSSRLIGCQSDDIDSNNSSKVTKESTGIHKSKHQDRTSKKKLISLSDLMDQHSFLIEPTQSSLCEKKQLISDDKPCIQGKRKPQRINYLEQNDLPCTSEDTGMGQCGQKKSNKTVNRDLERNRDHKKCARKKGVNEKPELLKATKVKTNLTDLQDREILLTDTTVGPLSDVDSNLNLTRDTSMTCSIRETTLSMSMSRAYPDNAMSSRVSSMRQSIDEFSQKNIRKGRNRIVSKEFSTTIIDGDVTTTGSSDADKNYKNSVFDLSGSRKVMRPSIVMTSLHSHEQDVVISVVKKLGRFVITDNVNETTTHVICGEARRTLNILHCLARGLWLLSKEWVIKSLEAGEWISEESFECVDYFPVCKIARLEREVCTLVYRQTLFSSTGLIYISGRSSPPRAHLVKLVKLCGGQVTCHLEKATVYVGEDFHPRLACVKTTWLLDCIKAHETLPLGNYSLDRPKRNSSPAY